jgi:hypothetical protein
MSRIRRSGQAAVRFQPDLRRRAGPDYSGAFAPSKPDPMKSQRALAGARKSVAGVDHNQCADPQVQWQTSLGVKLSVLGWPVSLFAYPTLDDRVRPAQSSVSAAQGRKLSY